mgnify:CR=1 FL=1
MSDTTPGPMEQWAITNYFDKGALLLPYLREQDAERAVLEQERDQLADKVKWENDFWDLDKKWSQRYRELDAERAALEQRVAELEAALRAYEQWEADMILDAACWQDGLPRMTQDSYDGFMEIQAQRNAALAPKEARS